MISHQDIFTYHKQIALNNQSSEEINYAELR